MGTNISPAFQGDSGKVEQNHEHQVALVVLVYLYNNGFKGTAAEFKR